MVIDDWSNDATAAVTQNVGGKRVKIIRPLEHRTIGYARQTALNHVETPWLMWIDADDEALPGRVEGMLTEARIKDADVVFDDIELRDGSTGAKIKNLRIPNFLRNDPKAIRQFERNFIPSLGWPLIRTELAKRVGYDSEAHGVEDFDFCLRAIRAGANFAYKNQIGYRQFAYQSSLSRNIYQRRIDLTRIYRKHEYEDVCQILKSSAFSTRVAKWILVAMKIFREDHSEALQLVDTLKVDMPKDNSVFEPDGPYPVPERWRVTFQRGTLLALLRNDVEAADLLKKSTKWRKSPDVFNNLGVVLRRLGHKECSEKCFKVALKMFPEYFDAARNLEEQAEEQITPLPLRLQPSRCIY